MQYGHFDNASREYVIDRVDLPVSWTNYIGTRDMYGVFNHTAGGYIVNGSSEYHRWPGELTGNMLLTRILGARLVVAPRNAEKYPLMKEQLMAVMEEEAEKDRAKGEKPYIIPLGGSVPIGMMGYYECACELIEQFREQNITNPSIVCAAGSLGTYKGLVLGFKNEGVTDVHIYGGTDGLMKPEVIERVKGELNELKEYYHLTCEDFTDDDVNIYTDFCSGAYNTLSSEIRAQVIRVARAEGIFLDPTYTGKVFNALCGLIDNGTIKKGSNVVFIHSGGVPGIFTPRHRKAFEEDLMDGVEIKNFGDD